MHGWCSTGILDGTLISVGSRGASEYRAAITEMHSALAPLVHISSLSVIINGAVSAPWLKGNIMASNLCLLTFWGYLTVAKIRIWQSKDGVMSPNFNDEDIFTAIVPYTASPRIWRTEKYCRNSIVWPSARMEHFRMYRGCEMNNNAENQPMMGCHAVGAASLYHH